MLRFRWLTAHARCGDAVAVPADALVLDWVLADAPPERAQYYDNNDLRDFHAPTAAAGSLEAHLAHQEEEAYARIRAERAQREQERAARVRPTQIWRY